MKTIAKPFVFAAACAAVLAVNFARAGVESGKPAPDFTFNDIHGKTQSLSDFKGKVVVLEWVNSGCPVVQRHYQAGNMQSTQKAAAAQGAVWIQINSGYPGGQGDLDNAEAAKWQKSNGVTATTYFRDPTGKVGKLYGAKATPHMYVINQEGTLVYQGAIDDKPNAKGADTLKANNYVKAALAAIQAGKPVEKAATQAYGCAIKYGRDT
jgi:peroxiredoxin